MATNIPAGEVAPPYTNENDLIDLSSIHFSDEERASVHAAAANAFLTPEVQNIVKIELNEFTQKTRNVGLLFDEIENSLKDMDAENVGVANGGFVPLIPMWSRFKQRYRRLLWESRDLATSIATSAEQFQTIILPLVVSINVNGALSSQTTMQLTAVIQHLDHYIATNERSAAKARTQAEAFQDLRGDITAFQQVLNRFGTEAENANTERINELTQRILVLNSKLRTANTWMITAGAILGVSLVAAVGVALIPGVSVAVLTAVSNTAAFGAGTSVGTMVGVWYSSRNLRTDIASASAERDSLEQKNDRIRNVRRNLDVLSESKINDIAVGLSSFEDIWGAIHADCLSIKRYLEDVKSISDRPSPLPLIMQVYLKNTNTLYRGLSGALKNYAAGIVGSGVSAKG